MSLQVGAQQQEGACHVLAQQHSSTYLAVVTWKLVILAMGRGYCSAKINWLLDIYQAGFFSFFFPFLILYI